MAKLIETIQPANETALVEPFKAENETKSFRAKAMADIMARNTAQQEARADIKLAVADYYATVEGQLYNEDAGREAKVAIEKAADSVAEVTAKAVIEGHITRKDMRRIMGESFGFKLSDKTGKATSTPKEPGNTLSKRISSVSIALEYVATGTLPDNGGESLPLVGQERLALELEDFTAGYINVRGASERIEKAIKDCRETLPLHLCRRDKAMYLEIVLLVFHQTISPDTRALWTYEC